MNLGNYREDLKAQMQGTPCEIDGAVFNVRRANTPEYNKAFVEIKRALFGVWYSESSLTDDQVLEATGHLLAEYLVTGWYGLFDENGVEVKHSQKAARDIFTDPEFYQTINLLIVNHSSRYDNYLKKKLEEDIDSAKKQ